MFCVYSRNLRDNTRQLGVYRDSFAFFCELKALYREKNAKIICENFALTCESFAFFSESFGFARETFFLPTLPRISLLRNRIKHCYWQHKCNFYEKTQIIIFSFIQN